MHPPSKRKKVGVAGVYGELGWPLTAIRRRPPWTGFVWVGARVRGAAKAAASDLRTSRRWRSRLVEPRRFMQQRQGKRTKKRGPGLVLFSGQTRALLPSPPQCPFFRVGETSDVPCRGFLSCLPFSLVVVLIPLVEESRCVSSHPGVGTGRLSRPGCCDGSGRGGRAAGSFGPYTRYTTLARG